MNSVAIKETISQAEGYVVSDMGGEKVMMSIESGKYYNLGATGGRIWELLASPTTIGRITEQLCAEFEVDRERCEAEVEAFLIKLAGEGLIINSVG
ncbi:lasso peptide biosynthesis PqqD family chaperone [Paenibacillus sp. NPDC058071]|uniref:lasso peptide biosynthesis PqqD family chaperone n=1 Tax=Paenibacillus sp. NPDC058071 TaxID=3346326 RepID=UPI0036DB036F